MKRLRRLAPLSFALIAAVALASIKTSGVVPRSIPAGCSTDTTLCLSEGRFLVDATWTKPDGQSGPAHAVSLTSESGYFWFLEPDNVEIAVKIVNGCSVNDRFWAFASGLTNLQVEIHVTDTTTNQVKTFVNPQGQAFQPIIDTAAFTSCPAGDEALGNPEEPTTTLAPARPVLTDKDSSPGCQGSDTALCLSSRFRIEATWQTSSGQTGAAHAVSLTPEAGYFWFFEQANVEMIVKSLDACGLGQGNWFFAAAMTTAQVQLDVTDTMTGARKTYTNPLNTAFRPIQDTAAFPYCPESGWPQWGQNPQHSGAIPVTGQGLGAILADVVYDPFVDAEIAEYGDDLLVHYAVPLIDRNDVYMETKSGTYVPCDPPGSGEPAPCGPDAWGSQTWNVAKFSWVNGGLVQQWVFASDWKPEPSGNVGGWEPLFLPVVTNGFLYVPGAGGTIHKVSKASGAEVARINPFPDLDRNRYVAGGLAAGADGSVYYDVLQLDATAPSDADAAGGWLVRIGPDGSAATVSFHDLVPGAPAPTDLCQLDFLVSEEPWPPSPTAKPQSSACGSQRPGINVVPAIARDGTIYTVSRAHFNQRYGYVVAAHPDLSPFWATSLRDVLDDGCGVIVPISPNRGCRPGTTVGVDPATNDRPAGRVVDFQTSSPVVLPDDAVLYGAWTYYGGWTGHLFKLSPTGDVLATFAAGFDSTPPAFPHDGTYSIVVKHNNDLSIISLDANLELEWAYVNTNTETCTRQADGSVTCVDDQPDGFEWCVSQPAMDAAGTAYANSDDGHLYAIDRSGNLRDSVFLDVTIGAAYAPVAIGPDGRIYAQNSGHLVIVGNATR